MGAATTVTVIQNDLPQNNLWTLTVVLPMLISAVRWASFDSEVSKRVGGQRGLAQGNPSHTINSRLFPVAPYE